MYSTAFRTLLLFLLIIQMRSFGQVFTEKTLSRADTLRGMLTSLRSCYDINYYHLDVKVDIDKKNISGTSLFKFTAVEDFKKLQFDLFKDLKIEKIIYKNQTLPFIREFSAVFVEFPHTIQKGNVQEFTVFYSGRPVIAVNPPWDGGFIFSKDQSGKSWVGVSCQGLGASSWWPNKDHQSDEVDSMLISVTVPAGLMNISNGRLRSIENLEKGSKKYNWFVSYPINNYNVTLNIADYAHFSDEYTGEKGKLTLDYYVLKENLDKARKHFSKNVKPMLHCFEYWFGPYPFYRDGYKLVEAPYLGMEHQSAVAYGNDFQNGYKGADLSGTGLGLSWDYIIIHESGHEWFGNNITSKDIADMWIHEAFTMYSEGLFVECQKGKEAGSRYIRGLRSKIANDEPIIGPYNVNKEGSSDMYYKGANMLQTIRSVINDDEKWRNALKGLNSTFGLKTVTTEEIINYFNQQTGMNLSPIFEQYLKYTNIPVLEIKKEGNKTQYRWKADAADFAMPARVKLKGSRNQVFIYPSREWRILSGTIQSVDTEHFYIETKTVN